MLPLLFALLTAAPSPPSTLNPPPSTSPTSDPRLARKVTLRLEKAPLSDVLAALGREAGVRLTVRPELADDPAVVWVKDQPASEVMRQLADLFGGRWRRRETSGSPRYELEQNDAARLTEEALKKAARERLLKGLREGLRVRRELAARPPADLLREADAFDDARAQRKLPPEPPPGRLPAAWELMLAARSASPVRELADGHWPALLAVAESLSPAQWDALADGRTLWLSTRPEPRYTPLPAAAARRLRAARPLLFPSGTRGRFAQPDGEQIARQMQDLLEGQWPRAVAYQVRVQLETEPGAAAAEGTLRLQVHSVMPPDFGGEQHLSPSSLQVTGSPSAPSPDGRPLPEAVAARRPARPLELPPLGVDPNAPTSEWLNRLLPRLTEAYDLNLVADAYRHHRFSPKVAGEAGSPPLSAALEGWVLPVSNWRWSPTRDEKGAFLLVRRRDWQHDRLAEIPRRFTDYWAVRLRQRKALSTEDAALMAAGLRDTQLENLAAVLRERGVELGGTNEQYLRRNRHFLRALGSLSEAERDALRAGKRRRYVDLPLPARHWLQAALDERARESDGPPQPLQAAGAYLVSPRLVRTATSAPGGSQAEYRVEDTPAAAILLRRFEKAGMPPARDLRFDFYEDNGRIQYFTLIFTPPLMKDEG